MGILKTFIVRCYNLKKYNPKKIYLLTTRILSDYDDRRGAGPKKSITQYYLAKKKGKEFYELFSKVKIEQKVKSFNKPIIEKIEFMVEYVKDPNKKLSAEELFYYITKLNTNEIIKKS